MQQNQTAFKILTQEQAVGFLNDGYVVVRQAFHPETAKRLLPYVWARLDEDPENRATWKRSSPQIEEVIKEGPVADIFTPRFCSSIDDLVGEGRWFPCPCKEGFGWVLVRFPMWHGPWRPPTTGWHVDGMHFHHHLTSPEQGLVGIEMLTDVEPGGGGTAVRIGSHKVVAQILNESEPDGLSYAQLRCIAESEAMDDCPIVEVIGEAGDVLWMHPYLVHARSPNIRDTVRIAANRCIALHEPMNLQQEYNSHYSLVERAIFMALTDEGFSGSKSFQKHYQLFL
ncbi:MAG: phytanoyl-CoA dioxygenase family protein [Fischerella sp. CENA71]|nr:phytanoyl-CoA dioxygenase family protein [Fischerella sp. CENA71]